MPTGKISGKFPEGFLWGAATASYQVEGGIENNDWARAAKEGRVPPAGIACDHYRRFEEDFDIARSLSHNAHRFSIEWARIEPEEGKFDENEIEHYRKVIQALRERGIEPFVTLWHFTLPEWFEDMGGFENTNAPKIFARYGGYVASKLGNEARFWMTLNEPLVWASQGYLLGKWPPFKKNIYKYISVQSSLISSHQAAYEAMKNIAPQISIGIAQNNWHFSSDGKFWNQLLKIFLVWFRNMRFLDAISKTQDFIGLNHYSSKKFGRGENLPQTEMGWNILPEGICHCILELKKYGKPIYITENGIADERDRQRADFIRSYLSFVKKAIDEGADVRGYFYWSLLDNFEWSFGFEKKFGLVELEKGTLERTIRPSALVYKEIIENGLL